jgi:hypothetical protein
MKKITFLAFLFWSAFSVYGQMTLSSGSQLVINSGSTVVAADITNNDGTIKNNGTLTVKGDVENNTSSLFDATSSGTVEFTGTSQQEITGTADVDFYGTVDINNSNDVALTATATGSDQTINGTLNFTSGNLVLNGFDLFIGTTDPTGAAAATGYIETNSTGVVKRGVPADGSTDVVFPVGDTAYNPLILQNSNTATADTFGVRVMDAEPANASTDHMVDRSWVVTENTAGGSDLSVTAQWLASEELTGFDRTSSSIGLTTDNGATYTWGSTGAASGSDPYTFSGSDFTGTGTFAVGDYYFSGLTLDLKVYLAGAYNATNHDMDNGINALIPTTDPYGLGTTVSAVPANAVDWVEVQLRNSADNTDTIARYAKFVDTTGQVINEDGSYMAMTGVSKTSYYVSVHHRNHLPVMSTSTVDFTAASPAFSFTTGLAQAWADAGVTSNNAMKEVETGIWGLWEGDVNNNLSLVYNGSSSDRVEILNLVGGVNQMSTVVSSTYSSKDVNLDGNVVYNGSNSDRVIILNNVGGVNQMSTVLSAHLPH